tara:strand:+ start:741 stop:1805 length:1065 start_codon:yes stop_codon:yes gene_type:complete
MSEIKVNSVVNSTGDNDSGLDLSTNDQVIIKTANTTAVTVDSSQGVTVAGAFTSRGIDDNADATAMTITSAEKIGIGTTSPDTESLVDLGSGENSGFTRKLLVTNTGNSRAGFGALSNLFRVFYADDQILQFGTMSRDGNFTYAEKMRIDTGSRLAFGNTDTNAKITVSQNGASLNIMRLQNTDGGHTCTYIQFANSGNNSSGNITQTGSNTVAYNTSSDYRLKENISYNFDATKRLKQLKPARFNFIDDGTDKTIDGFIAHEVSSIVPEAVSGTKDATRDIGTIKDIDGNITAENAPQAQANADKKETWEKTGTENIYQGIDLGKLVPLLVKSLQEALTRIDTLEAEVKALKG